MEYNFIHEKNRIYLKNEKEELIAEITFPNKDEKTVIINHTFVDESLRGKGIANLLIKEVLKELEKNNMKCIATCSFAISWFERNKEEKNKYLN